MTASAPASLAQDFVAFAVDTGVLRFGEFKTKAGRLSPYFFNAGLFDDGAKLSALGSFYARRLLASGMGFDMLFGPAYKGIPLAAAVAIELARAGRNVPFAYNRKEAKDHGEGGSLVGAPLKGRVLIIDDVMSAGTAARESIALIKAAGATPHAVAIALAAAGGDPFDLMIAHPPCTYLAVSGLHWNKRRPERAAQTEQALDFVRSLMAVPIPRIAIENPVGCISTRIRRPDQIVQPWMFGDDASKGTCLWLKGLPPLRPTRHIEPRWVCCGRALPDGGGRHGCANCNGEKKALPRWANQTDSGQNCLAPSPTRARARSETYQGIAEAFVAKVKARMGRLIVGSPLDKNTDIGPLVDRTQLDRVSGLVAEGARQGAQCWQPDNALP